MGGATQPGDLSAIFKDTSIAGKTPDFNAFLKKGDERIRMLEQIDRLPDLQRDFTQSQQRMVFQKAKALRGGLKGEQFSPDKLRELLKEMERLGRKGDPGYSGDLSEGMEALEQGQSDRAMEAMERALNKLRAMEEKGQNGKGLRGGREDERRGGRKGERGQGGSPGDEGDWPEGEGSLPGKGKSGSPKGDPSQRLRTNPFDVGVEGEARAGRKDGMDTNLVGRGGNVPSRLQYMGVLGQYRKQMEEDVAREQVPRDYHGQVKDYFKALDER
jgi:ribonuclease E